MATISAHRPFHAWGQEPSNHHIHTLRAEPRPPLRFTNQRYNDSAASSLRHDNDKADYREIQILPTPDEILAVDSAVYMPKKDLRHAHHLPNGPKRHLDSLFRQMRCDSIEHIRDICYTAAQQVFLQVDPYGRPQPISYERILHETLAGHRFFLYHDIKFEELLAHESKGILVRASYHCPSFMRGRRMYGSGRFQEGMLVALLQLDRITNELSVFFLEVSLSQSTYSMDMSGGGGERAAVQMSFLPTSTREDVLQLSRHVLGLCSDTDTALVEFPKVLFAGFYNCLKRLQEMGETDFAFQNYIAPKVSPQDAISMARRNVPGGGIPTVTCPPPAYAQKEEFRYDLSSVLSSTNRTKSMSVQELLRPSTIDILRRETSLDEGQAMAFRDGLISELALTQGPPGCGKTFLGVQLTKALLSSRPTQKPILLVCLTNHALDNFLQDLRDAQVTGLLRVGGGSKEKWTEAINLQTMRKKSRPRKAPPERSIISSRRKETFAEVDIMCKAISSKHHTGKVPWQYVEDILFEKYPHFHGQLSTNAPSVYAKAFAFEHWYGGGDLESIRDLHFELATRLNEVLRERDRSSAKDVDAILQDISYFTKQQSEEAGDRSLWNLPYPERQALLRQWEAEVDTERFAAKLTGLHFEYKDLVSAANDLSHQRDIKIMGDSNVIGMTTTGCAARWKQLASVGIEITLCEEAAEVMEAHTLCSLLPTVQHAIMIGDPLQLRPETDQQMLTLETQIGMDYRLDESLLERLMLPKDPSSSAVASTHLNIQRRMHPTIANIARIFYPYLRDHKSTLDNPPTVGLVHRMYWWDHRIPELEADDLKSHVNLYEVEMVVGLVTYLLRGGAYDQGDIAVLTPYAGQLSKLNEQLSTTCNIWLSEKDRQLLIDEEVLGLVPEGRLAKDEVPMADMLRIATVDNFQGEEAKIVVLSTVRSGGSAGFLKSINRINVACSRAREGFYIIGDTQTLSKVPMWRQVISAFDGNIVRTQSTATLYNSPPTSRWFPSALPSAVNAWSVVMIANRCATRRASTIVLPAKRHVRKSSHVAILVKNYAIKIVEVVTHLEGTSSCHVDTRAHLFALGRFQSARKTSAQLNAHRSCLAVIRAPLNAALVSRIRATKSALSDVDNRNFVVMFANWTVTTDHLVRILVRSHVQILANMVHVQVVVPIHVNPVSNYPSLDVSTRTRQTYCVAYPAQLSPAVYHVLKSWSAATLVLLCMAKSVFQQAFDVFELDSINLHSVYELTPNGTILSVNSNVISADLRLPVCQCGKPCAKTHRYESIAKLVNFEDTLDRLVSKMGRILQKFATKVDAVEIGLVDNFGQSVENIRPNPMATRANTDLILRRDRDALDLQKEIVKVRNEVIDHIQSQISKVSESFPNVAKTYELPFRFRFDVLEYRIIGIRIADSLQMAGYLLDLRDPSYGVQRQGMTMLEYAYRESVACANCCEEMLKNDRITLSPLIDVELRLHQIQFGLFAVATRGKMRVLGTSIKVGDAAALIDDAATVKDKLKKVMDICEHYPNTHKLLLETATDFMQALERSEFMADTLNVPKIKNRGMRDIEKRWGHYEVGSPEVCDKGHVYSARTFPEGFCPECGTMSMTDKEIYQETSKHLFEDRFLEAMRARTSQATTSSSLAKVAEKEVSNEDKFLLAMRQIGKK
ncbi:hypothetical protein LTS17_012398 [Exophiala oligosperma]